VFTLLRRAIDAWRAPRRKRKAQVRWTDAYSAESAGWFTLDEPIRAEVRTWTARLLAGGEYQLAADEPFMRWARDEYRRWARDCLSEGAPAPQAVPLWVTGSEAVALRVHNGTLRALEVRSCFDDSPFVRVAQGAVFESSVTTSVRVVAPPDAVGQVTVVEVQRDGSQRAHSISVGK